MWKLTVENVVCWARSLQNSRMVSLSLLILSSNYWLVVWNMAFIFPYIGNNTPNWLIFFRGVETTNHQAVLLLPRLPDFCSNFFPFNAGRHHFSNHFSTHCEKFRPILALGQVIPGTRPSSKRLQFANLKPWPSRNSGFTQLENGDLYRKLWKITIEIVDLPS